MRARFLSALLLALAAAVPAGHAQQPTFPSRVDLITVDVVVVDRQGNPVTGLTRDDFTIREDGERQAVGAFEAVALADSAPSTPRRQRVSTNAERPDAAGRWFFLVFDDIHITANATPRARDAIAQFIDRVLRPGDRVMIAPASGASMWTAAIPEDRADLKAYVQRLQGQRRLEQGPGRIWDHEAQAIALGRDPQAQAQVARRFFENDLIPEGGAAPGDADLRKDLDVSPGLGLIQVKARQTYAEVTSRLRVSLGTLERLAAALAGARGRKSLLFFSEGFIADRSVGSFRTLVQAARNANVAVHFVDVRAPSGNVGQPGLAGGGADVGRAVEDRDATIALALASREADGTRSIAADTGGSVVSGTNLLAGLTQIGAEGRAYYLLGYSSTNARRDGRFRKIEVTVNRRDVTVRARSGYFAPSADAEAPRPSPDTLDPAVRAALDAPFGVPGIPLRLASYVLGPPIGGKVQTLLVAEADPAPLRLAAKNGRYSATLDSYVLLHDRDRDGLERNETLVELNMPADVYARVAQAGIPILREFSLGPGRYQATLLLRDRATGAIGSVRHEFAVPAPNEFRITTPIITDTMQPGAAGQPGRPVPIARRTFKAGTRIVTAFEIYGATDTRQGGPQVSVAYTLRRADGTQVGASQPQRLQRNARGQFAVTIGILLPAGSIGEHELGVSVRDEAGVRVIEDIEPLTITP